MKKYCVVNFENKQVINKLENYGYVCIPTEKSADVSEPISLHADVLYLKISDTEIYVSECQKNNIVFLEQSDYTVTPVELAPGYKTECKLNLVVTENTVVYNPKTSVDVEMFNTDKRRLAVNQGYTKCATVVMGESFITEDDGIYKALEQTGKKCLLIKKGYVKLDGYDYGFIGGASAFIDEKSAILFFGDITKHPDYLKIKCFCNSNNITIDYISEIQLTDIGGIVKL